MTALERAKRFLQQKSRAIAMTAIPLAAIAVTAQPAKATITFSSGTCIVTPGPGTPIPGANCAFSALPQDGAGNIGFALTGSGGVTGTGSDMAFSGSGTYTGSFAGPLPVAWNFDVTDPGASPSDEVLWQFTLTITQSGGGPIPFEQLGAMSGSGTASGTASFDISSITTNVGTYGFQFVVLGSTSGTSLNVNIPVGSVDINAVGATPEPSTWSMIVLAGASLLWWRKRRIGRGLGFFRL